MQTVKEGSSGNAVYCLQAILRAACYTGSDGKPVEVDGKAGANTIFALREFQKKMIYFPPSDFVLFLSCMNNSAHSLILP